MALAVAWHSWLPSLCVSNALHICPRCHGCAACRPEAAQAMHDGGWPSLLHSLFTALAESDELQTGGRALTVMGLIMQAVRDVCECKIPGARGRAACAHACGSGGGGQGQGQATVKGVVGRRRTFWKRPTGGLGGSGKGRRGEAAGAVPVLLRCCTQRQLAWGC